MLLDNDTKLVLLFDYVLYCTAAVSDVWSIQVGILLIWESSLCKLKPPNKIAFSTKIPTWYIIYSSYRWRKTQYQHKKEKLADIQRNGRVALHTGQMREPYTLSINAIFLVFVVVRWNDPMGCHVSTVVSMYKVSWIGAGTCSIHRVQS